MKTIKVTRENAPDNTGHDVIIMMTDQQADALREVLEAVDCHRNDSLPVIPSHSPAHRTLDELRKQLALTRPE